MARAKRRLLFSIVLVLSCVFAREMWRNDVPAQLQSWWESHSAQEVESPAGYYRVVGPSRVERPVAEGSVSYDPLDELGRAGQVRADVTWELMDEGRRRERGDMQDLEPSGWGHNERVSIELGGGKRYNGYFWNRSHLVAKSLGGADILENVICGTRMQNVGSNGVDGETGGMAYCETRVRTWLEHHPDGHVDYVATPHYEGSELVCRFVTVDMRSSDGAIDERVEVVNAARGYAIDYATGEFQSCDR